MSYKKHLHSITYLRGRVGGVKHIDLCTYNPIIFFSDYSNTASSYRYQRDVTTSQRDVTNSQQDLQIHINVDHDGVTTSQPGGVHVTAPGVFVTRNGQMTTQGLEYSPGEVHSCVLRNI